MSIRIKTTVKNILITQKSLILSEIIILLIFISITIFIKDTKDSDLYQFIIKITYIFRLILLILQKILVKFHKKIWNNAIRLIMFLYKKVDRVMNIKIFKIFAKEMYALYFVFCISIYVITFYFYPASKRNLNVDDLIGHFWIILILFMLFRYIIFSIVKSNKNYWYWIKINLNWKDKSPLKIIIMESLWTLGLILLYVLILNLFDNHELEVLHLIIFSYPIVILLRLLNNNGLINFINKLKQKTVIIILITAIGTYAALWTISIQIYETKSSIVENKVTSIMSGIIASNNNKGYYLLANIQKEYTVCEPEFFNPLVTIRSLAGKKLKNEEISNEIKQFIANNAYDLEEANLMEVDLSEINLRDAVLKKANLINANLYNSNLIMANLEDSNLMFSDLWEADLRKANLERANLEESHLFLANLEEANLKNVNLKNSDLLECNLKRANLTNVNLENSYLGTADLSEAILVNGNLKNADLRGANLYGTNLEGTSLLNANFTDSNLTKINLSDNQIKEVKSFYNAKFGDNINLLKLIKKISPEKLDKKINIEKGVQNEFSYLYGG